MTDVLEDKTDLWEADLGPQQVIMVIFEFFISKVIPSVHRDRNMNKKSCRKSSREKCLSVSSFSSTTAEERACLFACL